jgi:hypothetical protein
MYSCKRPNDIDSLLIMRCIVTPLRKWLETTKGLQIFTDTHCIFRVLYAKRPSEFVLAPLHLLSGSFITIYKSVSPCFTYFEINNNHMDWRTKDKSLFFFKKRNTTCTFRKKYLHNYKHLHENSLGLFPKTGVSKPPLHAATKFLGFKQYKITMCINF